MLVKILSSFPCGVQDRAKVTEMYDPNPPYGAVGDDLVALGYIGLALLIGGAIVAALLGG